MKYEPIDESGAEEDTEKFIPRSIFMEYEKFRKTTGKNALLFFEQNPQHVEWGPWIITRYKEAAARYLGKMPRGTVVLVLGTATAHPSTVGDPLPPRPFVL